MSAALPDKTPPTYRVLLRCTNCDYIAVFNVPKGVIVFDYVKTVKCQNCSCNTLRPKWAKE
jgi:hypothetical protein